MPTIISGAEVSRGIYEDLKHRLQELRADDAPRLVAVLVGDDGASRTYVEAKMRACKRIGFDAEVLRFPHEVSQDELMEAVHGLNEDPSVDGFIVQLPLPDHISVPDIVDAIAPSKDVDGFHPYNFGRMALGLGGGFLPATPFGVMELMKYYEIETSGKQVVILGRSNIVGRPLSILLSQKPFNATVTVLHRDSEGVEEKIAQADILVAASGQPLSITRKMIKRGAVVIDVGISRIPDDTKKSGYALVGDVDYRGVLDRVSAITPVPGGVGPMTIAMLLSNTLEAFLKNKKI